MSFNSFMKAMLSEDLNELGFKHYKGSEWYKIIDNKIYLYVSARKLSLGMVYLHFNICSMFAEHLDKLPSSYFNDVAHLMTQDILSKGGNIGPFGCWLYYRDEKTEEGLKAIKMGQEAFALAKPVLASVHDLESCFEAKQRAGYLARYVYGKNWVGREYTPEDYTEDSPDDVYSILCFLGKYEAAADYLRRYLTNFEESQMSMRKANSEFALRHPEEAARERMATEQLIQDRKDSLAPYIEMAEARDTEKINAILLERYNANCDFLEAKHNIKIDRRWLILC